MPDVVTDTDVRHLLPTSVVGEVSSVSPIRTGLSGAGVYAVTTPKGEYILRVQGSGAVETSWDQHLLILRRAADASIAPPIVHVDATARAVISARVTGVPLPAVLADPAQRARAIADVVRQLRLLHALDASGIAERSGVDFARSLWTAQRGRSGFPAWAAELGPAFDAIAAVLARDARRVVSHNDLNPGNVLWDGARTWLVDWEVAALGHPYYDLAAFLTFLGLTGEVAYGLLAEQEQSAIDDSSRATFDAMRQLAALAVGNVFLYLVPDLTIVSAPSPTDAPTLADCAAAMRRGALDLQTAEGRARFGLAFLRIGTEV